MLDTTTATARRWMELISDPALLCDEAGIILRANHPAQILFSGESSQYAGVPVLWLIPAKSRDRFLVDWDRRSSFSRVTVAERVPMWIRDSHSRSVSAWMTIDEVTSFGRSQYVLVFKDVQISCSAARLSDPKMTEHLSSIRHDIRNPLSGIKVFTDVLLRNRPGNLDKSQIDHLIGIKNAAGNLASLIDGIDVPEALLDE